jgi:hypothetical protein
MSLIRVEMRHGCEREQNSDSEKRKQRVSRYEQVKEKHLFID